jgi:hypothetical protein
MHATDARPVNNRLLALQPPDVKTRRLIVDNLSGAATSTRWLPEGLSDEIDQMRGEHARALAQVRGTLAAVDALAAKHRVEDKEHDLALRQAAGSGDLDRVEDRRTPIPERTRQRDVALEKLWATVHVLGEVVEATVDAIRRAEPDLLAGLRPLLVVAQDKREEAARLLREAEAEEWAVHRTGQWVLGTADPDNPMGYQAAPSGDEPMPPTFNRRLLAFSLERPWYRPAGKAEPQSTRRAA